MTYVLDVYNLQVPNNLLDSEEQDTLVNHRPNYRNQLRYSTKMCNVFDFHKTTFAYNIAV